VTGATLPVTLGHEFSGTVEEVGADTTTRLKVGDRVAVKPNLYDGSCASCLMGRVNCCRNLGFIGYSSEFLPDGFNRLLVAWFADGGCMSPGDAGGLSDHVVVKEQHAIPLPGSFPLDIGGETESQACSL
jgi:threonine dehydrogenase-like Zn-dependent dehydrogenase